MVPLRFFLLLNSSLEKALYSQESRGNRWKTIAGKNYEIAVLAAVTNNPHIRNSLVHYLPNI